MWCEILDNLQFNKFLWNEWSLIVWCEAARRQGSELVMLWHPVNNCNNFLPLPTRPHIIRHLVFPWESVLRSQVTTVDSARARCYNSARVTLLLQYYTRLLHYICIFTTIAKVKSSKERKMLNIGWWSLLTRNIINIPVFRCIYACVHSMLYSVRGHRWLTSSIVLSKDLWSIVYRVQGTQSPGVIVLHSKDVVRLD